ncbi:MAG: hypothetical protein V7739_21035 [Motiliproteus sp.]
MICLRTKMLSIAMVSIFSASAFSAETIWQQGPSYVAISKIEGIQASNHPQKTDPKKLGRILSQLSISTVAADGILSMMDSSEHEDKRIFSDKEIHNLAQEMSKALSTAKNDEVVLYSMTDLKSAFFGTKRLSVSGTAFIKDNRLNLIFGEVHVDLQKKYVRSGESVSNSRFASIPELSRFKLDTGSITEEANHGWRLKLFSGAVAANNRGDWIAVDLNKNYDYNKENTSEEKNSSQYLSARQQETSTANIEQRLRQLEQSTANPPVQVSSTPASAVTPTVERLRILKSLFEAGSITEEIYVEKMRSIVNEI